VDQSGAGLKFVDRLGLNGAFVAGI
jgi:hypothetical protein